MTIEDVNKLHDMAKTRKDGVYTYKGNRWAVKNQQFIAYITPMGEFLIRQGSFNFFSGLVERHKAVETLRNYIKNTPTQ